MLNPTFFSDYGQWIIVASLSGVFNAIAAFFVLVEDCKECPFFKPYSYWMFWLWISFELLIPACGFWLMFSIHTKPSVEITLLVKSVIFGLSFATLVNSSATSIGPYTYSVKPMYDIFVRKMRDAIFNRDREINTRFWSDFTQELDKIKDENTIQMGLNYLALYPTMDADMRRNQKEKVDPLNKKIKEVSKPCPKRCEKIVSMVRENIDRKSLPECLKKFGCKQTLKDYTKHFGI
jgi:hypothetical protein